MFIYKTTNLKNDKIYIGFHNGKIKNYLGSGKILKQAIKRDGRMNFKREILEYVNEDNWREREIYWIKKLESRKRGVGYNIAKGGLGGNVGDEHYKKLNKLTSKRLKEQWKDDNYRKEMTDKMKGKNNHFYGKKHPKEIMDIIKKKLGKRVTINGIFYISIMEASKKLKISRKTITNRIKDEIFNYKFVEENKNERN